jgi:hypothetical protein
MGDEIQGKADPLIEQYAGLIPRGEAVLDLVGGDGARALLLASQGHPVDVLVDEAAGGQMTERVRWTQVVVHTDDVMAFVPPRGRYGAVIGLGLAATLDREQMDLLAGRIPAWVMDEGVVMLGTAPDTPLDRLCDFELVHQEAGKTVLRRN